MSPPVGPVRYTPEEQQRMLQSVFRARQQGMSELAIRNALRDRGFNSVAELSSTVQSAGVQQDRAEAARPSVGKIEGLVRSFSQGATLGMGDEIAGLVWGGDTANQERARQAAFSQEHPVLNIAGQAVGGIGPWGVAAGGAAMAPTLVGKLALGGLAGATMGGLQGAASAEPGNRLAGGVVGGVTGMATGIPTMGMGPSIMRRLGAQGITTQMTQDAGIRMAKGAGLSGEAIAQTQRELANQNAALISAGAAPVATIADTRLGQVLAASVAGRSGRAQAHILESLTERMAGAKAELQDILRMATGGESRQSVASARVTMDELRQRVGRTAFQPLESVILSPDQSQPLLAKLSTGVLDMPQIEGVWNRAMEIANARGYRIRPILPGQLQAPDFLTLQTLERSLNSLEQDAWKSGSGELARTLGLRRVYLRRTLEENFPGYADAQRQYFQAAEGVRAVDRGARLWRRGTDWQDERQYLDNAPPEVRAAYLQGAMNHLRKMAEDVPGSSRNPLQALLDDIPDAKLRLVLAPDAVDRLNAATPVMLRRAQTEATLAPRGLGSSMVRDAQEGMGIGAQERLPAYARYFPVRFLDPRRYERANRIHLGSEWLAEHLTSTEPQIQDEFFRFLQKRPVNFRAGPAILPGAAQSVMRATVTQGMSGP